MMLGVTSFILKNRGSHSIGFSVGIWRFLSSRFLCVSDMGETPCCLNTEDGYTMHHILRSDQTRE